MKTLLLGVALVAGSIIAANAQTPNSGAPAGSGNFCLKSGLGGASCAYQTMAACEAAKPKPATPSDECVSQSQLGGTTGSGGKMSPPAGSNPPAGNSSR